VRLTVYLFQAGTHPNDLLDADRLADPASDVVRMSLTGAWADRGQVVVQPGRARMPNWVDYLGAHANLPSEGLLNQTSSAALLLPVAGRWFGVVFGRGAGLLNSQAFEPRFGLKVCLNSIDPSMLRSMETRTLDRVARLRRTQMSRGQRLHAFDLNSDTDWVRVVSGHTNDKRLGKTLAGSDSLSVQVDCELPELPERCKRLLELHASDAYKESFEFIDHLQPLSKRTAVVGELDAELERLFADPDLSAPLGVALPEVEVADVDSPFKLVGDRRSYLVDELTLAAIRPLLDESPGLRSDQIKVCRVDENGDVGAKRTLRQYLTAEITRPDGVYLHAMAQWFRADADYVMRVREQVRKLDDISADAAGCPFLPPYDSVAHKDEGAYNEAAG